jgi:DNA-binding CsgD family transcriptional regulator
MNHTTAPGQSISRHRATWLLPEDGIVDPVAIDLAARGVRPVALTPTERRIAAARILAAGGSATTLGRRLRMSHGTARALIDRITNPSEAA